MRMISATVLCGLIGGCGAEVDSDVKLIGGAVQKIPQFVELSPVGCTGSIVGPHVMLTAGHCYGTGKTASFTYRGKRYTAKITRNAQYQDGNAYHDHSLGVTDEAMPGPYAYVDMRPLQVGETMQLQGYGCITPKTWWGGGASGADHQLRVGTAPIIQVTSLEYITRGKSALCFGDSGGPASTPSAPLGVRAVNSKGDIKTTSFLARLNIQSFVELANKVGKKICKNTSCQ